MNEEQTYPIPAESDKNAEASYGKFSSAEELLKAYNALEGEFTRRSQKLKEYEKTYGKADAKKDPKALAAAYGVREELVEEALTTATETDTFEKSLIKVLASKNLSAEQMASDERVVDEVLKKESNRQAVIDAYVNAIKSVDVPPVLPRGGASPALQPFRPRTVAEAGELAKAILRRN